MKGLIIIFFLIISIWACNFSLHELNIQTHGKLTIIDSINASENLFPFISNHRSGFYPILYIGKPSDTIRLHKQTDYLFSQNPKDYFTKSNFTRNLDPGKIRLMVDTSFNLGYKRTFWHQGKEKNQNAIIDSSIIYKSFPIFIYNNSDSFFMAGIGGELGLIVRQAKNFKNNWQDIESPGSYICSMVERSNILKPHQGLVAKMLRYKGDFKTECRLKYMYSNITIYSNTFSDYIDKRQLSENVNNLQ